MIWADRVALGLWAIWIVLGALLIGTGLLNGSRIEMSKAALVFLMPSIYALPLWLVLRIVDFMIGGPARRRRFRPGPSTSKPDLIKN